MKNLTLSPMVLAMSLALPLTIGSHSALAGDDHGSSTDPKIQLAQDNFHAEHDHNDASHPEADGGDHAAETAHGEEDDGHGHDEEAEEEGLHLTPAQSAIAGIEVATAVESQLNFEHPVPAQLLANPNVTSQLSLPVDARVIARHVNPGQDVAKGTPLLTLASSDIANAQGRYLLAQAEWKRVRSLGEKAISASRFQQARIDIETSLQDLLALGMTQAQIDGLNHEQTRLGQFELLAPHAGTVQQDNSVMQQNLPALTPLMVLANERTLWANAQVAPSQSGNVRIGQAMTLAVNGELFQATVIGRDHQLNPQTRTESIRLEVANPDHRLHAGQFATAYLGQSQRQGIVLPDSALSRGPDGDWMVYLYDGKEYRAQEIQVINAIEKQNLITGIPLGSQVVIKGAFFLTSEQAKSGLSIHNH
ncbi:efflux RND transporter periplasmic adaptor subunit [Ferrimonas sp. SCSIO 43195]|uniref:efflux RND transporter periplasmic adaptor subunit n=1 Tax=Ferrimonas sp. SCSIO 43195 TaxID=2822844 RepID=UPI002075602B|nr:efflux RND transporter periplasmic adaptor subunit [Ferrimonas sp. SCSIO 43195]USD36165.1 efflux RND transporter periplasmic adaptor subunit [Ferrimonas sp. SCSIO 43195]